MDPDNNYNYSQLDSILQNVHIKKIKLSKDDKTRAVQLCQKVEDKVMEKLKASNSWINKLTNGITYRGSYYGGVKVGSADEFDIDIRLKLPFPDYSLVEIENSENFPGFIRINIKKAYDHWSKTDSWFEKCRFLIKWMDKDGYLEETKLRKELESFLTLQFSQGYFDLELDGGLTAKVKIKKGGPAFTFHVICEDVEVDIDFVFVLFFPDNIWPPEPVKRFTLRPQKVQMGWFAVPKPTDSPRNWRISFPKQEEYFLDKNQNLKFIYRLLKAFRDCEKWNLASYHIATLFLWEAETAENNENFEFWQQSIGNLFIYMLRKLSNALNEKEINFFWHPGCNMIADKHPATLVNMSNRINEILKQIDKRIVNKDAQSKEALEKYILQKVFKCNL